MQIANLLHSNKMIKLHMLGLSEESEKVARHLGIETFDAQVDYCSIRTANKLILAAV